MIPQFRYSFSCGHIGISPILPPRTSSLSSPWPTDQVLPTQTHIQTTQISIPTRCAYCDDTIQTTQILFTSTDPTNIPLTSIIPCGSGMIFLLTCMARYTPSSLWPTHSPTWFWAPIRKTARPYLLPSDVELLLQVSTENFRYLAWLPKPVGSVRLVIGNVGSEDGGARRSGGGDGEWEWEDSEGGNEGLTARVSTIWRRRAGEDEVQTRIPGLLSQWCAVVLEEERARERAR